MKTDTEAPALQAKGRARISIDPARCKACGICIAFCPTATLDADETTGKVRVADISRCIQCGLCEIRCPDFAIRVREAQGEADCEPDESSPD